MTIDGPMNYNKADANINFKYKNNLLVQDPDI
jgi:hypothetical protein